MRRMKKLKDMLARIRRESKGFTLVELIVVIAILGILTAIAVPTYSGYVKKANTAADQTLLDSINSAFASACISNGVNVYEVTDSEAVIDVDDTTGEWADTIFMTHDGIDLTNDFKAYMGGDETAFRVIISLRYDKTKGMFVVGASKNGYTWTDQQKQDIDGSTYKNMGSTTILNTVDRTTSAAEELYGATYYGEVIGSDKFAETAAAALGVPSYADYKDANKEALAKKIYEAENPGKSYETDATAKQKNDAKKAANAEMDRNAAILVAAKGAQAQKDYVYQNLITDPSATINTIKNNMDPAKTSDPTTGLSQAALAYGLYVSYAQDSGDATKIANTTNPANVWLAIREDAGFKTYLEDDQGKADLKGLAAAMDVVSGQSAEAAGSVVTGGVSTSNTALLEAMKALLGE